MIIFHILLCDTPLSRSVPEGFSKNRDKLEQTIEASLQKAESLRQSILKKAFEGKLVPQDSNDEPAEKLLERIRAEREKKV